MRAGIVTFLCTFLTLSAHPNDAQWSQDPSVRGYYAGLLRAGGLGLTRWEAAAFLLLPPDGRYRCVAWPFSNGRHEQKYRGSLPDFTVAIVHTHPGNAPLPSTGDRATASRLGMPVIVLTPRSIYIAAADGRIIDVVKYGTWREAVRGPASRCEPADDRSAQLHRSHR